VELIITITALGGIVVLAVPLGAGSQPGDGSGADALARQGVVHRYARGLPSLVSRPEPDAAFDREADVRYPTLDAIDAETLALVCSELERERQALWGVQVVVGPLVVDETRSAARR
jgi:hypothetical protein